MLAVATARDWNTGLWPVRPAGIFPAVLSTKLHRSKTPLGAQTWKSVFRSGCALRGVNSAKRRGAVSTTWPIESLPWSQADLTVGILLSPAKVEDVVRALRSCVRRKRT